MTLMLVWETTLTSMSRAAWEQGMLRFAKEKHMSEEFLDTPPPTSNAEFWDCTFHKLAGATLIDCSLNGCKMAMTKPQDIIGLSLTLDCFTFSNLELSPEVFDFMLLLLCKTKGNVDKRKALLENVVGHDRAIHLLREFENLER